MSTHTWAKDPSDLELLVENTQAAALAIEVVSNHVCPQLRLLELHPTDRCNANCYFCNTKPLRAAAAEFPVPTVLELLAQASGLGLAGIRLSGGGEPTVYPGIAALLARARDSGLRVTRLNTNGIELTQQIAHLLLECRLNRLHVSLQAAGADACANATGRDRREWLRVISNIRAYKRLDQSHATHVLASFAIAEGTEVQDVRAAVDWCRDLGIECHFHDLNSWTYSKRGGQRCVQILREAVEADGTLGFSTNFHMVPDLVDWQAQMSAGRVTGGAKECEVCFGPWAGTLVRPNGDIFVCCMQQDGSRCLGNALRTDLQAVWAGSAVTAFRLRLRRQIAGRLSLAQTPSHKLRLDCVAHCPVRAGLFSHAVAAAYLVRQAISCDNSRREVEPPR